VKALADRSGCGQLVDPLAPRDRFHVIAQPRPTSPSARRCARPAGPLSRRNQGAGDGRQIHARAYANCRAGPELREQRCPHRSRVLEALARSPGPLLIRWRAAVRSRVPQWRRSAAVSVGHPVGVRQLGSGANARAWALGEVGPCRPPERAPAVAPRWVRHVERPLRERPAASAHRCRPTPSASAVRTPWSR
jgi:hypothetical protein